MTPHPIARPLPAAIAVGALPSWNEPLLVNGHLLWLETRPQEGGRATLLTRPAGSLETPRELTPAPWTVRSRLHGYGGGAFSADGRSVVFSHDGDRQLWCLDWPAHGASLPMPRRLTAPPDLPEAPCDGRAFGDGLLDRQRERWLGVLEEKGRDQLVTVSLAGGAPKTLRQADDFCGSPVLSPSGSHLAWLEWRQPFMPWERSELWLGRLEDDGTLSDVRRLAGSDGAAAAAESVVQPLWAGSDLLVARDGCGWWTLTRFVNAEHSLSSQPLVEETPLVLEAEFGMPRWLAGLRSTAWDGERLVAAACREGRWELGRLEEEATDRERRWRWRALALPFTDLGALSAEDGRLVAIASGPTTMAGLLEVDLLTETWIHSPATPCPLRPDAISTPVALWFAGGGGEPTHAWFYPPVGGAGPDSPLLIRAHSGPTAMARTGLNLMVQFWTSRGWGVVDVNYGGSSGFGRAYRERLNGHWGVLDVADCLAAAAAVVASGRAHAERVAMEGSSASGFTVLAALAASDSLRAGACRYPVVDLETLPDESHRFEAHYLDSLIGPWPAARTLYQTRSPLRQVSRLQRPVILFHGLEDTVVPASHSQQLARALGERGIPVEIHCFPGEGHGFRSGTVQAEVLEATEAFFRRHLGLTR
ncbi:MAG: prolyl oligopeptidase family serine peptidase [Cyanobacteriota bacterium]